MKRIRRHGLSFLIISALLLIGVARPGAAAAQSDKDEGGVMPLLVLTNRANKLDAKVRERLEAAGIKPVLRSMKKPISDEMLRLFPAVAVPDFSGLDTPTFKPRKQVVQYYNVKQNIERLHKYVQAGGGLFYAPSMRGGGQQTAQSSAALLQPLGAAIRAAQVRDDSHATVDGAYAWTTAIPDTPLSDGVQRLVYPTNQLRWDDGYATVPLVLRDDAWQPIAHGMPSSRAARGVRDEWHTVDGNQSAPVIAAARAFGDGRVAMLALNPAYTFTHGFSDPKKGWVGEAHTGTVDGIFLEKGDAQGPSHGFRLIRNSLHWLGDSGRRAGFGGYSEQKMKDLPKPKNANVPRWLGGWNRPSSERQQVLIGARSAYSSGEGSVQAWADAARAADCAVLVMLETFEDTTEAGWHEFVSACHAASDDELVVLPGLELIDVYQNRYVLFGQSVYPQPFMLNDDGDRIEKLQYLSLGFGTHLAAIHRPTTTPMPHQLYKHFQGISVFTYEDGKLVDDGRLAYQWHVSNTSQPLPLVVHEMDSPDDVSQAARTGHQLYIWSNNAENAAWYLNAGMKHFWETPSNFFITSGPVITDFHRFSTLKRGLSVKSDAPITDVQLRTHGYAERRWRPNQKEAKLKFHMPWSHLRSYFYYVEDAEGNSALTPALRFGPALRYTWRCGDRQNFFGWSWHYTGTRLPDGGAHIDAWGTDEGEGLWPHATGARRGENMAPLLNFPLASKEVYITEARLDQRYWRANWGDVGYDAKSQQGTARSRVYGGRVRFHDFKKDREHVKRSSNRTLRDWKLRLRMPVSPKGEVFPGLVGVGKHPTVGYTDPDTGKHVEKQLTDGTMDLPVGGYAGDVIVLSPGLRVNAQGRIGFAANHVGGTLPVDHEWSARYTRVKKKNLQQMRRFMGVTDDTPYAFNTTRGTLDRIAYTAHFEAERGGVAGEIEPAGSAPFPLPLVIDGMNPNWEAVLWRPGQKTDRFAVFEHKGRAEIDVTKGGRFFAGHWITADDPRLRLSMNGWDKDQINIVAGNPTLNDIKTTLRTPDAIDGKYQLEREVTIPAGRTVFLTFRQQDDGQKSND